MPATPGNGRARLAVWFERVTGPEYGESRRLVDRIECHWRDLTGTWAGCHGMAGMVIAHFVALKDVETAYIITVKRTSLLFAMLYGAWLFREPGLRQNLFAGVLMLAGVALVAWPA